MNILITSAGRRVSLVRFFQQHLKHYFPYAKVFTTDCNVAMSSACAFSDRAFQVCRNTHPNYVDELLNICKKNNVKMLIPTIDTELITISNSKQLFKQIGTTCLISDVNLVMQFSDKTSTSKLFDKIGINSIKEFTYNDIKLTTPIYVKPRNGSSSVDHHIIKTESELEIFRETSEKYIFQEYINPSEFDEYTTDLYFDKNSILKCAVPRLRIEVRGGEVSKAKTVWNKTLLEVIRKISLIPNLIGPITFQFFKHKNNSKTIGIEVNPRFGGGYPLTELAGAQYSRWIIEEYFLNKKIQYYQDWEKEKIMLRFDSEICI